MKFIHKICTALSLFTMLLCQLNALVVTKHYDDLRKQYRTKHHKQTPGTHAQTETPAVIKPTPSAKRPDVTPDEAEVAPQVEPEVPDTTPSDVNQFMASDVKKSTFTKAFLRIDDAQNGLIPATKAMRLSLLTTDPDDARNPNPNFNPQGWKANEWMTVAESLYNVLTRSSRTYTMKKKYTNLKKLQNIPDALYNIGNAFTALRNALKTNNLTVEGSWYSSAESRKKSFLNTLEKQYIQKTFEFKNMPKEI